MADLVQTRVPDAETSVVVVALARELLKVGATLAAQMREPGDTAEVDASAAINHALTVVIQEARRAGASPWSLRTAMVGAVAYYANGEANAYAVCSEIAGRATHAIAADRAAQAQRVQA